MTDLADLPVLTENAASRLNERQRLDYREEREACLTWLLAMGKTPKRAEGYARSTVSNRAYRMDKFYRWVWQQEGGYTVAVTHDHGNEWLRELAMEDTSAAHKNNCLKALQMLFKWREYEHGTEPFEPEFRFQPEATSSPRDYLTREERTAIREAALEYGSIPKYNDLSPSARDRWKRHLAQRLEKPIGDVTPDDWERVNGWAIPSLVWTSLDAGLRPVEVQRAVVDWVDCENAALRIPKEDSSKNVDNWVVGLRDRTATALERWITQRRTHPRYDESDRLWLTQRGNPHTSRSLKYLLQRLCEIADIDTGPRSLSWYAIRHSVGTYMTREEDLAAAQAQLRHKSPETTMKYDQTPVEDRQDALERMG